MMRSTFFLGALLLLFNGCATTHYNSVNDKPSSRKAWVNFHGQLSIIESTHRWQVLIQWQADLISGKARLTHAATGRIVELKWQGDDIQLRSNSESLPIWRHIEADELLQYGIVLPPQTIATILHHNIPKQLKHQGEDSWKGQLQGNTIWLRWQNDRHKLTMTDITHGRTAILRILP